MENKFQPLYDKVLVKVEKEKITEGGIVLADVADKDLKGGTVVAIGQGHLLETGKLCPLQVKVGQTVYFGKLAGSEWGEDLLVMREMDIMGFESSE